jgi:hypothetical protein
VGGALVLTRLTGASAAGQAPPEAPTLANKPSDEANKPGDKPADKPAAVDDSDAVDLSDLAVEKSATPAAPHAPVAKGGSAKPAGKGKEPEKKPEATKPDEKKPPVKKPGSGFVPPPVTDPGF